MDFFLSGSELSVLWTSIVYDFFVTIFGQANVPQQGSKNGQLQRRGRM